MGESRRRLLKTEDPVHRGTQASALCEGFSNGNVPCNPETDDETIELVQWMCGQGYTTGYTGNCGSDRPQ